MTRKPVSVAALKPADYHVARRFSGGLNPALVRSLAWSGGGEAWFRRQLDPGAIGDARATAMKAWFPSLSRTPADLFARDRAGTEPTWQVMWDLSRWTLLRRIESNRQVVEHLVDLWNAMLHVPVQHDSSARFFRVDYDAVIRAEALTSYERLLQRTITHPSMGIYLNNANSSRWNPSEDLARELLELHTVGRGSGYTEADVRDTALLLTGWRFSWSDGSYRYDPAWHHTGPVRIMGFSHPNSAPDGRPAVAALLTYLARHPATAQRFARRLARRFVSDAPPQRLVDALAASYRSSGSSLRPVLTTLVRHPDFKASAKRKVRTPVEDYVATARALQLSISAPRNGDQSFAKGLLWACRNVGSSPYDWPTPNGMPDDAESWLGTGRLLTSMAMHRELGMGWWPAKDVKHLPHTAWLPRLPARLGDVIAHIGVKVHRERPPAAVIHGIAHDFGLTVDRRVDAAWAHEWNVRRLVVAVLDSPTHFKR